MSTKRKKNREFIVPLPDFRAGVTFVVSDRKYFVKWVDDSALDYSIEESDLKDGKTLYEFGGSLLPVIWIDKEIDRINAISVAVHEITHATYWMLKDRGIEHNLETEEVFCYIHQYFIGQFLEETKL